MPKLWKVSVHVGLVTSRSVFTNLKVLGEEHVSSWYVGQREKSHIIIRWHLSFWRKTRSSERRDDLGQSLPAPSPDMVDHLHQHTSTFVRSR